MSNLEYVNVDSLDELEELYTKHVITYFQYINLKEKIKNNNDKKDSK